MESCRRFFPSETTRGRHFHFLGEEAFFEFFEEGTFVSASVSPAQDCDFSSFLGEGAGEDFHNRGFPGSAAGEVADADHEAADCAVADDSRIVHPGPDVDGAQVEAGGDEEQTLDEGVQRSFPALADDFDKILFNMFAEFAESHVLAPMMSSCAAELKRMAFHPRLRAASMLQARSSK